MSPSDPKPFVPLHVAIIMDGNGRWATSRGKPRTFGHKEGIEAVRRTLRAAKELSIRYLTLYSFSAENWRRPAEEVGELMRLLRYYLKHELGTFKKEGVRLRIIGDRRPLADDIAKSIENAEKETEKNEALDLTLALSYGGRQEIALAAQKLSFDVQAGKVTPDQVDEKLFESYLFTKGLPDPDLVIRTSGEKRISNFLLWQSAYAEYVFPDVLWPDFDAEHLREALTEFQKRDRRYGATRESK